MNRKSISMAFVAPVLLSFFVMSACDLVGIGVDNVKADFGLNNTLSQLISLAVFAWFFILSVPVGILQERIGKRNMLNGPDVFHRSGGFQHFSAHFYRNGKSISRPRQRNFRSDDYGSVGRGICSARCGWNCRFIYDYRRYVCVCSLRNLFVVCIGLFF